MAGMLFGLLPALQIVHPNLIAVLRQSGATSSVASRRRRVFGMSTWGGLVVTQIALSMVLLVGAGLMVKSLAQVASVDPGLQPQDLLTMRIPLPATRYDTADKRAAFFDEVVRRVEIIPGVRGVTVVRSLPTTPGRLGTNLQIQGQEIPAPGHVGIGLQSITPGFFRVVGVPVKRGREFAPPDNTSTAAPVAIVNESFARRFWPGYPNEDPLGKRILVPILDAGPLEIVGIVSDVHERGLTHRAEPQFYIPNILYPPNSGYLAVRTSQDSGRLAQAIRAEVLAIDPSQPVTDVRTMQAVFDASLGQQRLTTWLLSLFAGTAMLLAMIGLYGVLAYSVTQRTQEIGIRCALGARRGDIVADVVGRGLLLSAVGLACGLGAALVLTQVIAGLLFRVSPTDPITFVGISCLFLIVAVAASYIPARRAARVDPMRVLR
jgi:putative ABC transport system permease protein